MKKSLLVILAAPSGTGKSTICKELIKKNKKWEFSVSVTTRTPRDGEIDGKDYTFISNSDFEHYVKFGDFIEWEIVHGNKYGTLWSSVEDAIDSSKVMIFDIDVKGGLAIKEEYPDNTILLFIEPPGDNINEQKEPIPTEITKIQGCGTAMWQFSSEIDKLSKMSQSPTREEWIDSVAILHNSIIEKLEPSWQKASQFYF